MANETKREVVILVGHFIVACILGFVFYQIIANHNKPTIQERVVTVYDTITYHKPILKDSVILSYKTVTLPVHKEVLDTIKVAGDSVAVVIPISQKEYKDSTYHAWVSGYEPNLDSIQVYQKTTTVTIPQYIKEKPKRWGIGLQGGVGITPNRFQPYVGVGVSYNLFSW